MLNSLWLGKFNAKKHFLKRGAQFIKRMTSLVMKKTTAFYRFISSIIIVLICLFLLYQFFFRQKNSVVTINGMPVPEDEYKLHLSSSIAITYNYFHHKYGAKDHDDFWTTSYEGEVPLEYVKAKTNEKLIHIKVLQKLAIEEGLIHDFHYDDFLVKWDEDNRRGKATHEAGGIIYGPIKNSIRNYYNYLFSNLVIKLKRKLNQTRFAASDSTLKSYYETIKGEYFRYTPSIEVAYLEFPYKSSSQKEIALKEAHAAQKRVLEGAAVEALTGEFPLAHYGRVTYSDTALIYGEENPDRVRRKLALQLNPGDIKVLYTQESMNSGIYLMQCLGRSPERTLSFSTVKQDVLWYYQEAKYSKLVDSLKQNAVVRFNQTLYQSIKIR